MNDKIRNIRVLIRDRQIPVDQVVYVALISPIMTLPQLYNVWKGNSGGVSFITWIAYLCVATMWLLYGLKYKIKPIIVVQTCWIVVDSAVVLGLLIHR